MSSQYSIEKLDSDNYSSWAVQMKSLLVHSELWSIVCGREIKNESGTVAEQANFDNKDEKALASILLCIKPSQINYVKHCKSSMEAWKKLASVHMPSGPARKIQLFKQLLYMKMS
ncbi:hypothetical protein KR074_000918, partial [Drosophila pseudoananassae]